MKQHDKKGAFRRCFPEQQESATSGIPHGSGSMGLRRRIAAPVLTGLALAGVAGMALTGCGASNAQDSAQASQEEAQSTQDAETADTAGAAFSGESITDTEGTEADAAAADTETVEDALPDELEDGEEVLQRGDTDNISFHGTAPDLNVSLAENEAYLLVIPAYGSTGAEFQSDVYLTKDSAGTDGTYLDEGNGSDLMDPNTVIHGGKDGSLAGLTSYGDAGYLASHPYLYLYGDSSISEYQVFAAYPKEHEDILTEYNCYDRDEYNQYINGIFNQRNMQAVLNADLEQQVLDTWCILTLQAEGTDGEDFLVQAVPTGVENQ